MVQIHNDLADKGFELLACPCNQFGSQQMQDGQPKEILRCITETYGAKFPMLTGTIAENMCMQTTGKRQEPLFKWLRENSSLKGAEMKWNFEKFLINGDG